ncbi:hypothetical protein K458DRAFT_16717 [Lentithecium fluviatile CBS 122367]|uniref:Uncharacterized protein n=1 Tax=Lentithecium fluviatile CBS 122367 TaxID=1168545 RepID=A0A6G1J6B4_9PLEO|nr:hypothetical protein K458DRAFT_16717 [Lentithecium fluviatile CBS 122367]
MPFHHIRYLTLRYPRWFGACAWSLAHTWEHWLQDALYLTSRFRHLKHLVLQVSYLGGGLDNYSDLELWQPLFQLGIMKPKRFTKGVRRVVRGLAQINGKRMPASLGLKLTTLSTAFGRIIISKRSILLSRLLLGCTFQCTSIWRCIRCGGPNRTKVKQRN